MLYRPERQRRAAPAHEDDLPGLGRLDELESMEFGLAPVQVAITTLHDPVGHSGLTLPDVKSVRERLRQAKDAAARRGLIREMHVQLIATPTRGAVSPRVLLLDEGSSPRLIPRLTALRVLSPARRATSTRSSAAHTSA